MTPRAWKACLLLLALPALGSSASMPAADLSAEDRPFRVQDIRLAVEEKTRPFDFLLAEKIDQIVPSGRFVAFRSGRELWVMREGRPVRTLDQLVDLPAGFDWYEHACAAGDRLVVSVSRYPEEQRIQEEMSETGGFRAGPEPAGFLVVDLGRRPRARFLESFKVVSRPPLQEWETEAADPEVTLGMQSCAWDGDDLYVGDSGALARVDLDAGTVHLLEEDILGVNRPALVKDGDGLWYAAFMDAPWLGRWTPNGASSLDLAVDLEEGAAVDSLLRHRGRLLASSSEGVMEIDEKRRACVRYHLPQDPDGAAVYGLTLQHRKLLGVRDDGWVELDLSGKKAIRYRLEGPGADNRVLSIGFFDGAWYLGTVSGLVRVG